MLVAAIGFAIMAMGSNGLNTPNDQARAIAVKKGEAIAEQIYTAGDDADAKAAAEKQKSDFEGKLTEENKAIFTQVFDAKMTILAGTSVAEDTAIAEAEAQTEAAPAAKEVAAPAEDTKVKEATAALEAIKAETKEETRKSPYWLIFTYLILTFAELLLSPMGISFVSKVAPPKLKGLMMGGWFVATAIGNMLVAVGGFLWAGLPLWSVWTVFIVLCLLSALFMFVMMKRLESVTK
jgi:hypothetical protein